MAEFTFPCPQCKQPIRCDASYAGTQINCPACKQVIVVPSSVAAPGERVVQVKVSTLRTAAIVGTCCLLAAGLVWLALHFFAGPRLVTFKAFVDGSDVVKISGHRLWVEHLDFQLPARVTVNGKKWNLSWNGSTSLPYKLPRAFHPGSPDQVKLTRRLGRGDISILEMPSAANDETLSVKLDDGNFGGADWYEFTVAW